MLLVEDDDVVAATTTAEVERGRPSVGGGISVTRASTFEQALDELAALSFDLVVLDIRDDSKASYEPNKEAGDEALPSDVGLRLFADIRRVRFVPIVFYSAVAHLAEELHAAPFVQVVSKLSDQDHPVRDAVVVAINSGLPSLNRALHLHAQAVLRDYMQDFVQPHWASLSQRERRPDLAHLLARRLAVSLSDGSGLESVLADVEGQEAAPPLAGNVVHPMRMYIVPPTGGWTTGAIMRLDEPAAGSGEGVEEHAAAASGDHWVLLTPACDLVPERLSAEYVVLAKCLPLGSMEEVEAWRAEASMGKQRSLDALLANNRKRGQADRYHALPAAWEVPGLVVDFQQIASVPVGDLARYRRVADLDDPYAQSLISRFGRYLGRVGTPDVDWSLVRWRLGQKGGEGAQPVQPGDAEPQPEARLLVDGVHLEAVEVDVEVEDGHVAESGAAPDDGSA